jgi:hypothetical protein
MKTTITTVFALAGATLVAAQDFPSNMPECGVSSLFPLWNFAARPTSYTHKTQ